MARWPFHRQDVANLATAISSAGSSTTTFFGSQIGGFNVINYSYTDMPWKLLAWDVYYFFYFLPMLPYIVFPYTPTDSNDLDELAFTKENIWCVFIHVILCVLQLAFILALPFAVFFPVWMVVPAIGLFLVFNKLLCRLLNGKGVVYHSDPKYAVQSDKHAHEQWVFLNGVAVGEHWLKNNLNRLALTFGRPVVGIHNRTNGIIFDVVECLVQRNFGYATTDIRVAYSIIKEKLYNPQYSKVIFILHSQGGIEGGLVLDWLLQELPQNLLSKLEVYTFGNAANHFNNPHRQLASLEKAKKQPMTASISATRVATNGTTIPSLSNGHVESTSNGSVVKKNSNPITCTNSQRPPTPTSPPPLKTTANHPRRTVTYSPLTSPDTSSSNPSGISDRAIGHVEHYAHTTDFVALWGVLHFATSQNASKSMPRFIGRLFSRTSTDGRGGHQFVQHYLDGMFPLAKDTVTGQLIGCAEHGNEFMESEITVGGKEDGDDHDQAKQPHPNDDGDDGREAFENSYLGCSSEDEDMDEGRKRVAKEEIEMHNNDSPIAQRKKMGLPTTFKVKELSRLWKYRNGKSPAEKPPLLRRDENGVLRGATM